MRYSITLALIILATFIMVSSVGNRAKADEPKFYDPVATAIAILENAAANPNVNKHDSGIYQDLAFQVSIAQIMWPAAGMTWKDCGSNKLAFVYKENPDNTIWVCARGMKGNVWGRAQLLIHESAHLIGIWDECYADLWAISALGLYGIKNQIHTGYCH